MEQSNEPAVVGVRFSKVGKVYHFVAETDSDIKLGDMVVVETSRGWQLGQVAQVIEDAEPPPEGWKPIDRRATPRDLLLRQMWQMKEAEVISNCKAKSVELNLVGIKIVAAEYSFDGSRLTILFSSETEEKYDLKSLRSDMQKMFAPSQVEMRQIGPRDVAKTTCGMGACGLETRCCCLFLTEFSSISIRMAKEQGISLTPSEITGMCGRLRCCLIYEYDTYVDARSKLPKRNKRVRTPQGEGKVVDVIPLRGAVVVDLPEVGYREFPGDEVQLVDGEGPRQAPAPFEGTEQPSVMDQVITGDESVKPFVISAETPPPDSPWETPPSVEEPRSQPVPGRQDRPRRGGKETPGDREAQSGREPQGRRERPGGREQRRNQGPRADQPGGQPGGRGPRRDNRPPRPQGAQPKSAEPQEGQRPRGEGGGNPQGGTAAPGGNPPRSRDQRRKKGHRRDNNEPENRA